MNTRLFFIILLFLGVSNLLSGQCGVLVDAGPDQVVCPGGGTVSLSGSTLGANITGSVWSPTTGLSNPNSPFTSATVSSTTTYTLTAQVFDPTLNIINNGNFDGGLSGYTSDYAPGSGGAWGTLSQEGQYAFATNSNNTHTNFSFCGDHTGGGNMMVVNGAGLPNENVICQTVSVMPNTEYIFSAWLTSVHPENPAVLQFSINGGLLGFPFSASPSTCAWNEFNESWNSGAATIAQICIVNQNLAVSGNDFALDDIFFGPVCEQTDEVTIEVADIQANILPAFYPCVAPNDGIVLDASFSSTGPEYSYQWVAVNGGSILSGGNTLTPNIGSPGTYQLNITYQNGTLVCTESTQIDVTLDPNVPFAFASSNGQFDCTGAPLVLSGLGSSSGPNFIYEWTTSDGNIVSGETSLNPEVNAPGTYVLTVTNILNGCTATSQVTPTGDSTPPLAQANAPDAGGCGASSFSINGNGSDTGASFSYSWTTTDGNVTAGGNTLNPSIDAPGTYVLSVSNTSTGCTSTDTVTVEAPADLPVAQAGGIGLITCSETSLFLNSEGSDTGANIEYTWTTSDGMILNGADTSTPLIGAPGNYTLTVTDTDTGCSSADAVFIGENTTPPTAVGEPAPTLTCTLTEVEISGNGSSTGTDVIYNWTSTNGSLVEGQNTLDPTVSAPGDYLLTVTDTLNGCFATETVTVTINDTAPDAEAGLTQEIDCGLATVSLSGTGSSLGADFTYLWTSLSGNILTGETSLSPEVDAAGLYQIEVTNTNNGCTSTDTVTVTQNGDAPVVDIAQPAVLNCQTEEVELDAGNSDTGAEYSFVWSTSEGNFTGGETTLNPTIDAPGLYLLTIINNDNDCETTEPVTVLQDNTPPSLNPGSPFTLDCNNPEYTINASGSSFGSEYEYSWTNGAGEVLTSLNDTLLMIDMSGTYYLEIENTNNFCTSMDSVVIGEDFVPPLADAGTPDTLTCVIQDLDIGGSNSSSGAAFTYMWSSPTGNFTGTNEAANVNVDAPGTYTLVVTNTDTGCEQSSQVLIAEDTETPLAGAGQTAELNCNTPELTLQGTGSVGTEFTYAWSAPDGNILEGAETLNPLINSTGTYTLLVSNTQNGCSADATVSITQNFTEPTVEAGVGFELSCNQSAGSLNGAGSATGSEFSYQWTSTNGSLTAGETSLMPEVNAPGTYLLTVLNTDNGCAAVDSVIITQDVNVPVASIQDAVELNCAITSFNLDASQSDQGSNLTYTWSTDTGNILEGENTLQPLINAPGIYLLNILNTDNNCEGISSITITQDITEPTVDILPPGQLTCSVLSVFPNAENSDQGANFTYTWTSDTGNIVSGAQGLNPEVDAPGIYQLNILNTGNQCSASQAVQVFENITPPVPVVAEPELLTCVSGPITLSGAGSSQGTDFSYEWSGPAEGVLSGANTLSPVVNTGGAYTLLITNTLNDCTASATLTLNEDIDLPVPTAEVADILDCEVTDLSLTGSVAQPGDYTYLWSSIEGNIISGQNEASPLVNEPGIYTLSVTNTENGCANTAEVLVEQDITAPLVLTAQADELTCVVSEISLDAGGTNTGANFSYLWTSTNGNILSGETTLFPQVNAAGVYTLSVLNTDNNCSTTESVNVTENTTPPVVDAGSDSELDCISTSLILSGTASGQGDLIYSWTSEEGEIIGSNTLANLEAGSPGVYLLTVTDSYNGCSASDATEVSQNLITDFNFSAFDPTCLIATGGLVFEEITGGTAPYLYSIDGGNNFGTEAVFTGLDPMNYDLTVQDTNGCEETAMTSINAAEDISVFMEPVIELELGDSIRLNPFISFPEEEIASVTWTESESLSCLDCLRPYARPFETSTYTVLIRNNDGCEAEARVLIRVNRDVEIFFPNAFSPNSDGNNEFFYPFAGTETVREIKSFRIYDRWGTAIFQRFSFQPNNPTVGWDGRHRGEAMNAAVFAYAAEVEFVDGRVEVFKGDVTLVR